MRFSAAVLCLVWAAEGAPTSDLPSESTAWVSIPAAELRARYDTLWAFSDVHGRLEELERLLLATGLAERRGKRLAWNPARRRQLVIGVGDYIDGGPDSVGCVMLLADLQVEARAAESRVVVLLGNHEVAYLDHPLQPTRQVAADGRGTRPRGFQGGPRRGSPPLLPRPGDRRAASRIRRCRALRRCSLRRQ